MHPPFYFILKINNTLPLMGEGTNPTRTTLAGFEADAVRGVGEWTTERGCNALMWMPRNRSGMPVERF